MTSDFTLVDPKGWEYDLHSIYTAYIGYFQLHNIPWYDRSWGHLFASFPEFLTFSWPTITLTDTWTSKPHIVTRLTSLHAFLKMIKTRFGETLPQAPNILQITPFETASRHLRHIADWNSYKRLYATLPAVVLSAMKVRVKAGEPKAIRELWERRDRTFLAIDFEWSERNESRCLEWGYAAVRCGHLDGLGHWPPDPSTNYRAGHVIISEYVNKYCPSYYAFGESQVISKTRLAEVITAIISLASPDSETTPNTLVLVAHGISADLARLDDMKIKLPHNILTIDTSVFERTLHSTGARGLMLDPRTSAPRLPHTTLSLEHLLRSFAPPLPTPLPSVTMHNAGNAAYMALFALQMLLDPATGVPTPRVKSPAPVSPPQQRRSLVFGSVQPTRRPVAVPMVMTPNRASVGYDLAEEFGAMRVEKERGVGGGGGEKKKESVGSRGRRVPGRGVSVGAAAGGRG